MISWPLNPWVLAYVAIYALATYNCARLLFSHRSPPTTLAWILAHLFLPWIAVPVFLLVGDNRLTGYTKRKREASRDFQSIRGRFKDIQGEAQISPEEVSATAKAQSVKSQITSMDPSTPGYCLSKLLSRLGMEITSTPSTVRLLVDGEATFEAIFHAISQAKRYILVQYYILRADRLGLQLRDLLVAKAKQGVKIYLLYDDMGSFRLNRHYLSVLDKAGVEMTPFLPLRNLKRAFQMNFRNHRKTVVVDGIVAFTGGLNVGDEYVGKAKNQLWRDTHLEIQGGAVSVLQNIFLDDWYFAAASSLSLDPLKEVSRHLQACHKGAPIENGSSFNNKGTGGTQTSLVNCQVACFGPTDQLIVGSYLFIQLVAEAKKELLIATPYFVPDRLLMRSLELAVLRGVNLKILVPQRSDFWLADQASYSYLSRLRRIGARIYFFQEGIMHQKVITVDEDCAVIGTANIDNRSLYLNFETMVLTFSKEFCQNTKAMLEQDLGKALPWASSTHANPSLLARFGSSSARLLAPLL